MSCLTLYGSVLMAKMRVKSNKTGSSARRIVVVLVPPVDELDLIGPVQVFNSVNRLAGRKIYSIEVVSNVNKRTIESESGVLAFISRNHFEKVAGGFDSVL